jgi:hypothetical protein
MVSNAAAKDERTVIVPGTLVTIAGYYHSTHASIYENPFKNATSRLVEVGTIVLAVATHEDWAMIVTPDGRTGWITSMQLEDA